MKIQFKFTEEETERPEWIRFKPRIDNSGFKLALSSNGHFDPRPVINTNVTSLVFLALIPVLGLWSLLATPLLLFGWGSIALKLPLNTNENPDSLSPTYGVDFYCYQGKMPKDIWIYNGYKVTIVKLPWSKKILKKEHLLKHGAWLTENRRLSFYEDDWKDVLDIEHHDYKYTLLSGKVQHVTATVYQMRVYSKSWFGLWKTCERYLEIKFSEGIGEGTGSWKGGVLRCSYKMLKGETSYDALKRMESERKFLKKTIMEQKYKLEEFAKNIE